jgi:hypothetical protein
MSAIFRFGQRKPPPFPDEPPLTVSTNDIGRSVGLPREQLMDAPPEPDPEYDPAQLDDDGHSFGPLPGNQFDPD